MRNLYLEKLVEHLEAREWEERDIKPLVRMIGHNALTSFQTSLAILEYQQMVDERIEAEAHYDNVFNPNQGSLYEYGLADREGEALPPQLEITDIAQTNFNKTWNHWE